MVQLVLSTTRGNGGTRFFPHQGYLGLTPIRVDGLIRTRLDEDQKPIHAKSLTVSVRAYESRQGKTGSQHCRLLVDYSQTLWRKPDGLPHAELGDFEQPFKITLPKRVAGFSTANYQDYRTFWRLEAVLEHVPSSSVGSRLLKNFDLLLIRHDIPPPLPPPSPPLVASLYAPPTPASPSSSSSPISPPSYLPSLSQATNKPRAPILHYNLSTPTYPIGPSDLLFTSLFIRPLDSAVTIRSASLLVERRIDLHEIESSALTPSAPPPISVSSSLPEKTTAEDNAYDYNALCRSTSTIDSAISTGTITSRTPLIRDPSSKEPPSSSSPPLSSPLGRSPPAGSSYDALQAQAHKTITTTVAAAEGASFALDKETGVWSKTISLQWPSSRSQSRWSMGETMRGSLGAVSFWVRVKVIVTSSSGTETIDLSPREILVVLTNDAERRQALTHFTEARSVSKSRATTSPSPHPSSTSHSASSHALAGDRSRPSSPPPTPSVFAHNASPDSYIPYSPPKSATASSTSPPVSIASMSTSSRRPMSPSSILSSSTGASVSASAGRASVSSTTSSFSKVLPKRKSRRPHTSAGPRDSLDVRVGGAVPVPVPMPVPSMGYSNTSNGSPNSRPESQMRQARGSVSSGQHSPSLSGPYDQQQSYYRGRPPTPPPKTSSTSAAASARARSSAESEHNESKNAKFKSLNTSFTGLNGIGGPGAVALVWNQQKLDAEGYVHGEERVMAEQDEKPSDLVRAWEEELARIEKASRRSSRDMLGFWGALGRRKAKGHA